MPPSLRCVRHCESMAVADGDMDDGMKVEE
jgi:hypothetical protein